MELDSMPYNHLAKFELPDGYELFSS